MITIARESQLVYSRQGTSGSVLPPIPPTGQWGHSCKVKSGKAVISNEGINAFDFELTVPFDDDMTPNESEIVIYNLSQSTISLFKINAEITIEAGYTGDTGVIFKGYIKKVHSKREQGGKVTTIYAVDDIATQNLDNVAFGSGLKASYILKSLLERTGLPIAAFKPIRDHTYDKEVTISGDLYDSIKTYADVCGISAYVSKGKIYAQSLKEGNNTILSVSSDTGLIGSPEMFEEERTMEGFTDVVKGLNFSILLQHRANAAVIVDLQSRGHKGKFRIRSGTHRYSPDEAVTEVSVIYQ